VSTAKPPVDQRERYDRVASGYEQWWAPVLAPSALAVLDEVDHLVGGRPAEIVDLGTGTGTLARAMIRRWPVARVTAVDLSDEMLRATQRAADEEFGPAVSARLALQQAPADRLPFADDAFDLVVSSFVLQLVPNREAVYREVRRVLRPGGRFAFVTWLGHRAAFVPDRVVDDVLEDAGFEPPEPDPRRGDPASVGAVTGGLRRAGYREVHGRRAWLSHAFTPEGYAGFIEEFDEEDTFASMARRTRDRAHRRLLEGLRALTPEELTFRVPIVYATATAP
jgi:ubiquinone/menaquinone biosynthesis C-methylase UbiE